MKIALLEMSICNFEVVTTFSKKMLKQVVAWLNRRHVFHLGGHSYWCLAWVTMNPSNGPRDEQNQPILVTTTILIHPIPISLFSFLTKNKTHPPPAIPCTCISLRVVLFPLIPVTHLIPCILEMMPVPVVFFFLFFFWIELHLIELVSISFFVGSITFGPVFELMWLLCFVVLW